MPKQAVEKNSRWKPCQFRTMQRNTDSPIFNLMEVIWLQLGIQTPKSP